MDGPAGQLQQFPFRFVFLELDSKCEIADCIDPRLGRKRKRRIGVLMRPHFRIGEGLRKRRQ